MKKALGMGMPKNGQMRAGWERARHRTGHSSHSCRLTGKETVVSSAPQEPGLGRYQPVSFGCEIREITGGDMK